MIIEDYDSVGSSGLCVGSVEELAALWTGPVRESGTELRTLLTHTYSTALQGRWSHGGYRFVFLTQNRNPVEAKPPTGALVKRMLATAFRTATDGPVREVDLASSTGTGGWELPSLAWGSATVATAAWLDEWLLFRHSRPYVWQDDVPESLDETLSRPWHQCVRDVVEGEPWSAAAVFAMDANRHLGSWGDHGAALVVATAATVVVVQVGLWTD
ncbi:hypothetical protein GCM10022225_84190 [Plantactinospora mayteni]|uniref:Uncharacterized protein n=1 Tax=Plantactinospora mayteni TaxID=566021 RepID=A0ABQ4F4K3_9ACTN|nr:hypothetical protein [Plantactinospora mayteni]GIH01844.1 hypothetical protein Pma05_84160 [Plantactinospora mayteni]